MEVLPSSFKFDENEKILCYQGALLYEAKCLKAEMKPDGSLMYLVHYAGWNKHYDEWVAEARCLKMTPSNLEKQAEILQLANKDRAKRIKLGNGVKFKNERISNSKIQEASTSTKISTQKTSETKALIEKTMFNDCSEKKSVSVLKKITPVHIPYKLKSLLGDDWVFVNHDKMLYNVPSKYHVEAIIDLYYKEKRNLYDKEQSKMLQIDLNAMIESFNVSLGCKLLCKFERPQYSDMIDQFPNLPPSQIYGIPHFVRYFSQIESAMKKHNVKEENVKLIRQRSQDVLSYICNNLFMLFSVNNYFHPPAEYHRRTLT